MSCRTDYSDLSIKAQQEIGLQFSVGDIMVSVVSGATEDELKVLDEMIVRRRAIIQEEAQATTVARVLAWANGNDECKFASLAAKSDSKLSS